MKSYYQVRGAALGITAEPLFEFLGEVDDQPWMRDGACRRHDPDMWFPDPGNLRMQTEAKTICHHCPVRRECLDWSLDQGPSLWGIWGGLNEDDRRKLRGRRRAA